MKADKFKILTFSNIDNRYYIKHIYVVISEKITFYVGFHFSLRFYVVNFCSVLIFFLFKKWKNY